MPKKWVIERECVRCVNIQAYPMTLSHDLFAASRGNRQYHRSELYPSEEAAFKELERRLDSEIKALERELAIVRRKKTMASQGKNG